MIFQSTDRFDHQFRSRIKEPSHESWSRMALQATLQALLGISNSQSNTTTHGYAPVLTIRVLRSRYHRSFHFHAKSFWSLFFYSEIATLCRFRCDERIETFSCTFSSRWRYVKRPRTPRSTATRRWPMAWVAWAVAEVDDDATWAPVFSVAAVDAPRKTYHPPPHCWAMAKAHDPPVPAAAAGTPGSTRSRTIVVTAMRDRAAAGQTANVQIIIIISIH